MTRLAWTSPELMTMASGTEATFKKKLSWKKEFIWIAGPGNPSDGGDDDDDGGQDGEVIGAS